MLNNSIWVCQMTRPKSLLHKPWSLMSEYPSVTWTHVYTDKKNWNSKCCNWEGLYRVEVYKGQYVHTFDCTFIFEFSVFNLLISSLSFLISSSCLLWLSGTLPELCKCKNNLVKTTLWANRVQMVVYLIVRY